MSTEIFTIFDQLLALSESNGQGRDKWLNPTTHMLRLLNAIEKSPDQFPAEMVDLYNQYFSLPLSAEDTSRRLLCDRLDAWRDERHVPRTCKMPAEVTTLLDQLMSVIDREVQRGDAWENSTVNLGVYDQWDAIGFAIADWANTRDVHPDTDADEFYAPDGPVELGKAIIRRHGDIHDDHSMLHEIDKFMDW